LFFLHSFFSFDPLSGRRLLKEKQGRLSVISSPFFSPLTMLSCRNHFPPQIKWILGSSPVPFQSIVIKFLWGVEFPSPFPRPQPVLFPLRKKQKAPCCTLVGLLTPPFLRLFFPHRRRPPQEGIFSLSPPPSLLGPGPISPLFFFRSFLEVIRPH